MVAVFAKRLVLGASLGLGVLDVAWLDVALAPRVLASAEPAHEARTQPAAAPLADSPAPAIEPPPAEVAAVAEPAGGEPIADVAEPAGGEPIADIAEPAGGEPIADVAEPAGGEAIADVDIDVDVDVDEQVFFASMRAELGDDARTTLAAAVRQAPDGATYLLAGHADYRGEETYNRKLGLRRAQAVAAHLVELGVARERVRIGYIGEERPNAPDELWRDRRVDIQISGGPR